MTFGAATYGQSAYGEAGVAATVVTAPLATALAVGFGAELAGDTATATAPLATATAVGLGGTASHQSTVGAFTAAAIAVGFNHSVSGGSLLPKTGVAIAAALPALWAQVIPGGTDDSNAFEGRSRGALATGTVTRPVAPVPAGLTLGQRVDKAIAYPTPTMVNGRPT